MANFFIPSALVTTPASPSASSFRIERGGSSSSSGSKPVLSRPRSILLDSEALVEQSPLGLSRDRSSPAAERTNAFGMDSPGGAKSTPNSSQDLRSQVPGLDFSNVQLQFHNQKHKSNVVKSSVNPVYRKEDHEDDDNASINSSGSISTCRHPEAHEGEYQIPYWAPPPKHASPSLSHRSHGSSFRSPAKVTLSVANSARGEIICKTWESYREFVVAVAADTLLHQGNDAAESRQSTPLDEEQRKNMETRVDALVDRYTGLS